MIVRVTFVVACVLGLLWAFGPIQQPTRTQQKKSGSVTRMVKEGPKQSLDEIRTARENVEKRLFAVEVPTKMLKNGKLQRLSREQRRNYAVLAAYFKHDPVMVKVAACESSLRHTLPDGTLQVSSDGHDVGAFQLRLPVHQRELVRHGLNPTEFTHNVAFATYLYRRDGLRPWNSSRSCWETLRFMG